jgi:small subunit ribosomal protein S21
MQVFVRDNNIDQALRILKKKMQREGIFREIKKRSAYEKPSERKSREKAEAIRRIRKLARKKAQREGLIPLPKPKEKPARPRDVFRSSQAAKTPAAPGTSAEPTT